MHLGGRVRAWGGCEVKLRVMRSSAVNLGRCQANLGLAWAVLAAGVVVNKRPISSCAGDRRLTIIAASTCKIAFKRTCSTSLVSTHAEHWIELVLRGTVREEQPSRNPGALLLSNASIDVPVANII